MVVACLAVSLVGAGSGPAWDEAGVRRLVGMARVALDAAGTSDEVKSVGAELWVVRRRVATKEELTALAVQAEEGDEACLCGKTSPSTPDVERQARLLAEAGLLFYLAGDKEGAERNLARLRNVAHKGVGGGKGGENNATVWQLLVRMSLIIEGGDGAMREAGGIGDGKMRVFVMAAAADTEAVEREARVAVLGEAMREWRAEVKGKSGAAEVEKALSAAVRRAGMKDEVGGAVTATAITTIPTPKAATELAAALMGNQPAVDVAGRVDGLGSDIGPYLAMTGGGEGVKGGVGTRRVEEVGGRIKSPVLRAAFLTGALREMTKGAGRGRYDDALFARAYLP